MAKLGAILVVGGGVAGLSTAAALHRHGFTTELVERQRSWQALGAGFLIQPNGMRMLRSLGLAAGVENAGAVVRRWQFCNEQGDVLSETDLEALWGDAGPCVGIERPELQRALLPGVADLRCRLGTSLISLEQNDRRVLVGFSDGSTGDYDLVVGADGIRSTVRALTLTTAAPSDLGAMNWRSIAPIHPAGLSALQIHLGEYCLFGLVPMGAGRTYGFAYALEQRFHDPLEGRLQRVRNRFASFGERVQQYLASLERDHQVICSAMEWMACEKWYSGRVVLVGDAAHASSPMMGQGGCMAMEDACVLAEEMSGAATVESALASYVSRRAPRVKWVQHQSMKLAENLTAGPSAVRNAALREHGNEAMRARFGPLVPAP
ncbi:MAG: FAD-dependent monooxygenase [Betaproteobacteria bacterium]|nr:FAD-dependent monooxygenase [Betaproteobacteria bacterium]MDE2208721.1 FAD-dependent monooxygenase [Betaproteobacteria bacterium]MDE2359799.1 FAD-dependent monooxygenase [Betaproteobacteria bacterium]